MTCPNCGNTETFNMHIDVKVIAVKQPDGSYKATWDEGEPQSMTCSECSAEIDNYDEFYSELDLNNL